MISKPQLYSSFGIDNKFMYRQVPISIYIDCGSIQPDDIGKYKVFVQLEPPPVYSANYTIDYLIKNQDSFDLILAWDEDILKNVPKAKRFLFGTTWIDYKKSICDKTYSMSFICGQKNWLEGHKMRNQIYNLPRPGNIPCNFHYTWDKPQNKDLAIGSSQFSVVVENGRYRDYFSEKIIDAMVTWNIPLYWGCTNINDYFDKRGIINIKDIDDYINKSNSLNPDVYESRLPYIEANYRAAIMYDDLWTRLDREIDTILLSR